MSPRRSKWDLLRHRAIWILIILLVPPFIIFFSGAGQAPRSGGIAGTIFGAPISHEAFEQRQAWVSLKLSDKIQGISRELLDRFVQQQVWQDLLFLAEAKRQRLRVDDRDLAAAIARIPVFQQDGRFRADYYRAYLRSQRTSSQFFEALLRDDLLIERLISSVNASISVSAEEVKAAYHEARDRLQASLLVFDASSYAKDATAALLESDLRAYYDAHREEFRVPGTISLEYAGMSRDEMMARLQPSEEELHAFYERHPEEFAQEDGAAKLFDDVHGQVRQRMTEITVRRALTALAIDLDEDLKAKRPFEEIVTTRALSPRSAGPLDPDNPWVPNAPEPALLEAAKDLKGGEMSRVIETDLGVYVARVTQRIPSHIPPFAEVRAKAQDGLVKALSRAAANEAAQALRAKLEEQRKAGVQFEEALLVAGKPPDVRPVSFTRTDPIDPMGSVPDVHPHTTADVGVNKAVFDTPVGALTEVLETPKGFVIVRPEALMPADEATFAELADSLRKDTLTKKQHAHFEQWVKDLQARAKVERSLKSGDSHRD